MKLHNLVALAAAGAALLSGCGGGATSFNINVVHKDCVGGTSDYFSNQYAVALAVVRITGDDMEPVEQEVKLPADSTELPLIPYGKNRVIEVALFKDAAGKVPLGYGKSAPVEVTEDRSPEVTVVAYPLLDAVRAANTRGRCAQLVTSRAGASIAKLNDGRVLVAGGYTSGEGFDKPRGLTDTAEIIDPRTGSVTAVAKMCPNGEATLCSPRAYGPAVTLPDGRVLIAGGMTLNGQNPDSAHALIYDPAADRWTQVLMNQARRYNTATQLAKAQHRVLVVGGVGDQAAGGAILDTTEIFDAKNNTFEQGATLEQPIARHGAAYFTSKKTVGVAGGITTNQAGGAQVSAALIAFDPGTGEYLTSAVLRTPVVGATVAQLGNHLLVFGGGTAWEPFPDALAEGKIPPGSIHAGWQTWDGGSQPSFQDDPSAGTAFGCGAALDLNRTWLGGGVNASLSTLDQMRFATITGSNPVVSPVQKLNATVEQTLEDNVADFGCVALSDKQIMIVGGWGNSAGGANHALNTIEMFTVGAKFGN